MAQNPVRWFEIYVQDVRRVRRKETDDQKSDRSINPCGRAIDSWVITSIECSNRNPAPHRKRCHRQIIE